MGNFHCIPTNCGTVTYREYLPPVVRWRYPGEEWQEIQGDDYFTEEIYPENTSFVINVAWDYYSNENYISSSFRRIRKSFAGKILNVYGYKRDEKYITHIAVDWIESKTGLNKTNRYFINTSPSSNYIVTDWIATPDRPSTNCEFKVFNQEQLVYIETRDTCPEVEKLSCRLSEKVNKIKVEKISYYQGIEIVNFARDTIFTVEIPQNCLNIYNTNLQPSIIPLPDIYQDYNFVDQICSFPGCPPPKYEVICDCNDCESCPENTCAVECEGNICCYDKVTGKSIKSIPIDNYCGDEL